MRLVVARYSRRFACMPGAEADASRVLRLEAGARARNCKGGAIFSGDKAAWSSGLDHPFTFCRGI